jgi:broad specificity phosphatase PhoE
MGMQQAQKFSDFWFETFDRFHKSGKLHFFVSPMKRNMQTADPLLTRLGSCKAQVRPDLCETSALLTGSDRHNKRENFREFEAQNTPENVDQIKKMMAKYEGTWEPNGMSAKQVREKFPWATPLQLSSAEPDEDGLMFPAGTYGARFFVSIYNSIVSLAYLRVFYVLVFLCLCLCCVEVEASDTSAGCICIR